LQLFPAFIFTIMHVIFITVGTVAICQDGGFGDQACGHETRIMMYSKLNLLFAAMGVVTYFFVPPGECARVRAIWLIAFHVALFTWGLLMRINIASDKKMTTCDGQLQTAYPVLNAFGYYCIAHNGVCFALLSLHETWLGSHLGYDLTLVPEPAKYQRDEDEGQVLPIVAEQGKYIVPDK